MPTEKIAENGREAELLRHAADIVVEVRTDGRIVFINDAVERILGRNADAYIGRSFLETLLPEDRAETLALFQKVVTTGAQTFIRYRVSRHDGSRIQFEATLRIFENADGERRVVCVARDVTQRSAEHAVARERDHYYRALVESGARPAAIVGPTGEIIFSNQHF